MAAVEAGFDHYFVKPSEPEQLKNLLDRYAGPASGGAEPVLPTDAFGPP
jgi:hypothetical protein